MIIFKVILFILLAYLFGYTYSKKERNKLEAFKVIHEQTKEKYLERRDNDLRVIGKLNSTIQRQKEEIRTLNKARALRIVEKTQ